MHAWRIIWIAFLRREWFASVEISMERLRASPIRCCRNAKVEVASKFGDREATPTIAMQIGQQLDVDVVLHQVDVLWLLACDGAMHRISAEAAIHSWDGHVLRRSRVTCSVQSIHVLRPMNSKKHDKAVLPEFGSGKIQRAFLSGVNSKGRQRTQVRFRERALDGLRLPHDDGAR